MFGAVGGLAWIGVAVGYDLFTEIGFLADNSEVVQIIAGASGTAAGLTILFD